MFDKTNNYLLKNIENGDLQTVNNYCSKIYDADNSPVGAIYGIAKMLLPMDSKRALLVIENDNDLFPDEDNYVLYALIDESNPLFEHVVNNEFLIINEAKFIVVTNMIIDKREIKNEKVVCVYPVAVAHLQGDDIDDIGEEDNDWK